MRTVPVPSLPSDESCDPATKAAVQAIRDALRRDEPYPDEPPMLDDWYELEPLPGLSDDRTDFMAGWEGGAQW